MTFVLWYMILGLVLRLLEVIVAPFCIGKPLNKGVCTPYYCVVTLIKFGLHVLFCYIIWSHL